MKPDETRLQMVRVLHARYMQMTGPNPVEMWDQPTYDTLVHNLIGLVPYLLTDHRAGKRAACVAAVQKITPDFIRLRTGEMPPEVMRALVAALVRVALEIED